jgi:spore maturation protein CgeB
MKILLAGFSQPWAIERYFIKYLKALGAEIIFYPSGDIVYDFHTRNLLNKILFHSKIMTKYPQVNAGLLQKAKEVKPDIIWVFKGMEIYPDTLRQLKKDGFRLANYNPDHPFIITSKGSGNKNVTDSVGLYDLHFCYHNDLIKQIRERFGITTVFLPFAYDDDDVTYTDPTTINEIGRVCFQGNPDAYRVKMISMLCDAGIPVDVYGHNWDKTAIAGKSGIRMAPVASRPEFWRKNQEYRVQLNLFREYNFGSHNMRTFEIPVVGGIQLTPYSEEQAGFFTADKEIFFFNNEKELIEKSNLLLSMGQAQIKQIREQTRARSLNSGYSFASRASTVFNAFKQLL